MGISLSQRTGWVVSGFTDVLVKKIRSYNSSDPWKRLDDSYILRLFVKSKEEKKQIDITGQVDLKTVWLIRMFFETVAIVAEQNTGRHCYAALDLTPEGFGRAFVISEDYVLCCATLRDAHKFSFTSETELAAKGEKYALDACSKAAELGII